jgi:ATP-binding cassette subfamily F protein 3
MLARFGFRGEDVFKSISVLSGGERARVSIAKMVACGVSLLILDEPTNHLDIDSREMLETALNDYDGTIIAVSHDRYFIRSLATSILEIDKNGYPDGFSYKNCGYDEFIEKRIKTEIVLQKQTAGAGKTSFEEAKQRKNQFRSAKTRYAAAEKEIAKLEEELFEIKSKQNDESILSDYVALNQLYESEKEHENKIDELYSELERLEEIISSYNE